MPRISMIRQCSVVIQASKAHSHSWIYIVDFTKLENLVLTLSFLSENG